MEAKDGRSGVRQRPAIHFATAALERFKLAALALSCYPRRQCMTMRAEQGKLLKKRKQDSCCTN